MEHRYVIPRTSYKGAVVWGLIFVLSASMVSLVPLLGLIFIPGLLAMVPAVWLGYSVYTTEKTQRAHLHRFLMADFGTTLSSQELSSILSLADGSQADVIGPEGHRLRIERFRDELVVKNI